MSNFRKKVIRCVSVLSWLFAVAGFVVLVDGTIRQIVWKTSSRGGVSTTAFWSGVVVNAVFLIALCICAGYLWQLRGIGLRVANILFALELGYLLGAPAIEDLFGTAKTSNLRDAAQAYGIGEMGLAPQLLTMFPIIALVLLNAFWPNIGSVVLPRPPQPNVQIDPAGAAPEAGRLAEGL